MAYQTFHIETSATRQHDSFKDACDYAESLAKSNPGDTVQVLNPNWVTFKTYSWNPTQGLQIS